MNQVPIEPGFRQLALRLVSALVLVGAIATTSAPGSADILGSGQLLVAGTQLSVSPESQTVPQGIPTEVATSWGSGLEVPSEPGLRVLGDLTGPEVDGVLLLETSPGSSFRVPGFSVEGQYVLDNIRLVQDGEILAYAHPRSAGILVTQVLMVSVQSRPLTLDEIRSHGIVISEDNFDAFSFTFGFAVGGEVINYEIPVMTFYGNGGAAFDRVLRIGILDRSQGTVSPRFEPPTIAPFSLHLSESQSGGGGHVSHGGCIPTLDEGCTESSGINLPGAIVFPTDVSILHQFFSVVVLAQNAAPEGDPLVLRDLTARVHLPPGLRAASTEPPVPLGAPVPIRVPGADGILGTGDDITFLVAQATGKAEVVVEGVQEGTHIVEFELEGVLEGLPTGLQRMTGSARGAVLVRNPALDVTVTHPEVVRADEEYSLFLTVSNTGVQPVNLIGLALPIAGLSGVEVLGDREQQIETLMAGESEVVEFHLRSLRTGRVVATSFRTGTEIAPRFELTLGVGDAGIPLSPASLILPSFTEELPEEIVRQALGLLGLGYSLSAAPSLDSNPELPRVSEQEIKELMYWLAQAGRHVRLGEDLVDSIAVLTAEWLGARYPHAGWDRLRRITNRGGSFSEAAAETLVGAGDPEDVLDRLATSISFLPGMPAMVMVEGESSRLQVSDLMTGDRVSGRGSDEDRLREIPYADLLNLGGAELALLARTKDERYQVQISGTASETVSLNVVVPLGDGGARRFRWDSVVLGAGGLAVVDFDQASTELQLLVDRQGDGLVDDTLIASVNGIEPPPFAVVAAKQNVRQDPAGHIVEVLFSHDLDLQSLSPRDPGHFEIPGKVSSGGMVKAEENYSHILGGNEIINPFEGLRNTRVVRVQFDNPLSPYIPQMLTVSGVDSMLGESIANQVVEVATTTQYEGTLVEGRVIGPDGQPVPFAQVVLFEADPDSLVGDCTFHATAGSVADAQGHFLFDYVRKDTCRDFYQIKAQDPATGLFGRSRGRVRFIGETVNLDIVMLGRGTVQGRVTYEDGSPVTDPAVFASSPAFNESVSGAVDAEGNYILRQIPVGTVTLGATDGDGGFVAQTVEIPVAGAVVDRDLTIVRTTEVIETADVRGTVVDATTQLPVFDAYVALYVDGQLMGVQRSGIEGGFDFGTVPAGLAEIEAFDGGTGRSGAQLFLELQPDQVHDIVVPLRDERGTVEGYVTRNEDGQATPLAGAVVWASGTPFNTVTDENGFYRLSDVFVGQRTVLAADIPRGLQVSAQVSVTNGSTIRRDLTFVVAEESTLGAISGQFLGIDGNPIAGGTVHLRAGAYSWHHTAHTNLEGWFTIPDLTPGSYEVQALSGGQGATAIATVLFEGHTATTTLQVQRGTIRGVTKSLAANGVPTGVRSLVTYRTTVVVSEHQVVALSPVPYTIETAEDGTFELPNVLIGPYVLTISNSFFGERTVRGELTYHGQEKDHEILFEENGEIRGVVLSHDGVTPVPGVHVELNHPAFSMFDGYTNENGEFLFALVPPAGGISVDATVDDGLVYRTSRVGVSLTRFGQEVDLEIVLPAQGTVLGWVEDANGVGTPGAVVTLQEAAYPRRRLVQNADAEGFFRFDNIFVGDVSVSAKAPSLGGLGGRTSTAVNFEGEDVYVQVVLEETGEVAGTVLHPVTGDVVPYSEVNLFRGRSFFDSVTADENGEFGFRLLPLGTYGVEVFDPSTGRFGRTDGVAVEYNGHVNLVTVVLEARGEVEGNLIDPDIQLGVPGVTVALQAYSIRGIRTYSSTDVDGYFEFLGIPEGEFTLSASEPSSRRSAKSTGAISSEGERIWLDLILEPTGTVLGSILPPLGLGDDPVPGANVTLVQRGQTIGASLDNPFALDNVIVGERFTLAAHELAGDHRARVSTSIPTGSDETTVELRWVPIGSVRINVFDSFMNPVEGADVRAYSRSFYGNRTHAGSTDATGGVEFLGVGAGSLSISATEVVTGLRGSASGTISSEDQIVIDVTLQDTGSVRGRVVLASGEPAVAGTVVMDGPRTLHAETDADGYFNFGIVLLGDFTLHAQELDGLGYRRVLGDLQFNGEDLDLGTIVLDDEDPRVVALSPALGARDLPLDTQIQIEFSEEIDTAAWQSSWIRFRMLTGANVSYSRSWDPAGRVLTLTPTYPLQNFTAYEILVETPIVDLAGRHLAARLGSSFTTVDALPPAVIDTRPLNGAVEVDLATTIFLTFSEPLEPASAAGSALQLTNLTTGQGVTTTSSLLAENRMVQLNAVSGLETDSQYSITIQGVADLVGNVMTTPVTTTFWTLDTTAPEILSVVPADGESFISGELISFDVQVSDEHGVAQVTVEIDGWTESDSVAPFSLVAVALPVSTPTVEPVTVTAFDSAGNSAQLTRSLTISPRDDVEQPTIEVTSCYGNGDWVAPGDFIPLSFVISDDQLLESYELSVNGAVVEQDSRTTVQVQTVSASWAPPLNALPGDIFSVQLVARDYGGNSTTTEFTLKVPEGVLLAGNRVLDTSLNGQSIFLAAGTYYVNGSLELDELVLLRGASVRPAADAVRIDTSFLEIQCGAEIEVSGTGFPGATDPASEPTVPIGVSGSELDAGGSHGGAGLSATQPENAGEVFDSVYRPQLGGGGGSILEGQHGGSGGGVVVLQAEEVVLNGEIHSRGATYGPGGAGGTIVVRASTLQGSGLIDVSGGYGFRSLYTDVLHGSGGGGRVTIHADLIDFDPVSQVKAHGGPLMRYGSADRLAAPGTVFLFDSNSQYGDLLLLGGSSQYNGAPTGATELPLLGSGSVVSAESEGGDLWISSGLPFLARWLGVQVEVSDLAGVPLGTFMADAIDQDGRLLLIGAAGLTPDLFRGFYSFDSVQILDGAGLIAQDEVVVAATIIEGDTEVVGTLTGYDIVIRSGATLRPAEGGVLRIEASGQLIIEQGAVLDVSGLGYPSGAGSQSAGEAPVGVEGAYGNAGGAHGGGSRSWEGAIGSVETFDSVYRPSLPGGGAGGYGSTGPGGPGGGVVSIRSGSVVLDGEIRAFGGEGGPGGAGGSVLIEASSLSGSGSIDVRGLWGPTPSYGSVPLGAGGGGRVAIHAALNGFDLLSQVNAKGGPFWKQGPRVVGAAGSIYLKEGPSELGQLLLVGGSSSWSNVPVDFTVLPELGGGSIEQTAPVADSLWIESDEPFKARWLGAWIELLDIDDQSLGTFEVVDLDLDGRLLAAGAGGTNPSFYRGIYRFDEVLLTDGAGIQAADPLDASVILEDSSTIAGRLEVRDMLVREGTIVQPHTGGVLDFVVENQFVLEQGATLYVSALGFPGGEMNGIRIGGAPDGVAGAVPDSGGSHGGEGIGYDYPDVDV
ncbi:MAG: Ig-like domain-containing protein, partial [Thermoanaerobaculia bacterium]|nr:Ig-like domain-containing protein [Thermoanaerobaculia bacterium]